jgi:hypothetical protein
MEFLGECPKTQKQTKKKHFNDILSLLWDPDVTRTWTALYIKAVVLARGQLDSKDSTPDGRFGEHPYPSPYSSWTPLGDCLNRQRQWGAYLYKLLRL